MVEELEDLVVDLVMVVESAVGVLGVAVIESKV